MSGSSDSKLVLMKFFKAAMVQGEQDNDFIASRKMRFALRASRLWPTLHAFERIAHQRDFLSLSL
jgi:hypothetical protein